MAVNPMMEGARAGMIPRVTTDAHSAGVNGINTGLNGVAHAAHEIASLSLQERGGGAQSADRLARATESLLDLRVYQRQVEASAVVLKTADAVVGFLLDVHA